jgi:hypothetical protein
MHPGQNLSSRRLGSLTSVLRNGGSRREADIVEYAEQVGTGHRDAAVDTASCWFAASDWTKLAALTVADGNALSSLDKFTSRDV